MTPYPCYPINLQSPDLCTSLDSFLNNSSDTLWNSESRTQRRILKKEQPEGYHFTHPDYSWFNVTIDDIGNVTSEHITDQYHYLKDEAPPLFQLLQKVALVATKAFAEENGWKNRTLSMAMTIAQHHKLKKGEASPPLPWHRDSSAYTMVLLLSDEQQWNGGAFHFRLQKKEEREKVFQPQKNKALIFCNEGTQHRLDPLVAKVNQATRTILTLHTHFDIATEC